VTLALAAARLGTGIGAAAAGEAALRAKAAPYFSPRPGAAVTVDPCEARAFARRKDAQKMRGAITVHPPKGQCLTITRRLDEPDDVVCQPKRLSFAVGDLDRTGRVQWRVVGPGFEGGLDLSWPTPHRMAIVERYDAKPTDPAVYKFVASCRASWTRDYGRRASVLFFDGDTWTVKLPDVDVLVPQPPPRANLFMDTSKKVSLGDAVKAKKAEGGDAKSKGKEAASEHGTESAEGGEKAEGSEHGDKAEGGEKAGGPEHGDKAEGGEKADGGEPGEKAEGGEHGGGEGHEANAKPKDAAKKPVEISETDDRTVWAIPRRGSYGMPADYFLPAGNLPPGLHGTCRYTFDGPPDDPGTGRLECHDADMYRNVLIALPCLAELKPPRNARFDAGRRDTGDVCEH
jgi:hypothetical protein